MSKTVSNAGPFIHLAQINRLDLLSIFPTIYLTPKVVSEITVGKPTISEITSSSNIKIFHTPENEVRKFSKSIRKFKLQLGELYALCLCSKIKASLFLTDDLDARTAALNLGFEVHGSIGIIARAFHKGLINLKETEQAIFNLYYKSNLFVTKGIINSAINEIRRLSQK